MPQKHNYSWKGRRCCGIHDGGKNKRGSVMNNASFHKRKDRQPMRESTGHVFLD
ncbi:hypothetical protein [Holospora curviuscula]|uniref:hypothetical protein n=1 Tax=Holospora curviuscula TaxID=1082868 RepID=UPI001A9C659C|nr:hypothetical protein [Holospora curviuscula]